MVSHSGNLCYQFSADLQTSAASAITHADDATMIEITPYIHQPTTTWDPESLGNLKSQHIAATLAQPAPPTHSPRASQTQARQEFQDHLNSQSAPDSDSGPQRTAWPLSVNGELSLPRHGPRRFECEGEGGLSSPATQGRATPLPEYEYHRTDSESSI
jgi:hypothetical protein